MTKTASIPDQDALNQVLGLGGGKKLELQWRFLDGCEFRVGCHLHEHNAHVCAGRSGDLVMQHANYVVGHARKVALLKSMNMWCRK